MSLLQKLIPCADWKLSWTDFKSWRLLKPPKLGNDDFYDFCERAHLAGIRVPIIAGIMPVTSRKGLARMADLALGVHFPAKLLRALSRAEDDEYVEKVGVHWATEQVRDLIDHNVRGVHFYTLNKSTATLKIYETLGVKNSESLKTQITDLSAFK